MDDHNAEINVKIRRGWTLFGLGMVLIVGGILLNQSHFLMNNRLVSALGVLVVGISIGVLVKYLTLKRHPEVAQRVMAEEDDERSRAIHDRAGRRGFEAAMGLLALVFIVYSAGSITVYQSDPDPVWWFLAFLVSVPLAVYIFFLVHYQEKM